MPYTCGELAKKAYCSLQRKISILFTLNRVLTFLESSRSIVQKYPKNRCKHCKRRHSIYYTSYQSQATNFNIRIYGCREVLLLKDEHIDGDHISRTYQLWETTGIGAIIELFPIFGFAKSTQELSIFGKKYNCELFETYPQVDQKDKKIGKMCPMGLICPRSSINILKQALELTPLKEMKKNIALGFQALKFLLFIRYSPSLIWMISTMLRQEISTQTLHLVDNATRNQLNYAKLSLQTSTRDMGFLMRSSPLYSHSKSGRLILWQIQLDGHFKQEGGLHQQNLKTGKIQPCPFHIKQLSRQLTRARTQSFKIQSIKDPHAFSRMIVATSAQSGQVYVNTIKRAEENFATRLYAQSPNPTRDLSIWEQLRYFWTKRLPRSGRGGLFRDWCHGAHPQSINRLCFGLLLKGFAQQKPFLPSQIKLQQSLLKYKSLQFTQLAPVHFDSMRLLKLWICFIQIILIIDQDQVLIDTRLCYSPRKTSKQHLVFFQNEMKIESFMFYNCINIKTIVFASASNFNNITISQFFLAFR